MSSATLCPEACWAPPPPRGLLGSPPPQRHLPDLTQLLCKVTLPDNLAQVVLKVGLLLEHRDSSQVNRV